MFARLNTMLLFGYFLVAYISLPIFSTDKNAPLFTARSLNQGFETKVGNEGVMASKPVYGA